MAQCGSALVDETVFFWSACSIAPSEFDVLSTSRMTRSPSERFTTASSGRKSHIYSSSHRWLWSRIDELSGHHRRYNRKGLTSGLTSSGFDVLESRYLFTALVPGLIDRRFLSRRSTRETAESGCGLKVSPIGNCFLQMATGPGDVLLSPLRHAVDGGLLAVARKRRVVVASIMVFAA